MTEYEELERALDAYIRKFDEGFPTYQYMRVHTPAETIAAIKRCVAVGKDAYSLGYVTDDEDVEY